MASEAFHPRQVGRSASPRPRSDDQLPIAKSGVPAISIRSTEDEGDAGNVRDGHSRFTVRFAILISLILTLVTHLAGSGAGVRVVMMGRVTRTAASVGDGSAPMLATVST